MSEFKLTPGRIMSMIGGILIVVTVMGRARDRGPVGTATRTFDIIALSLGAGLCLTGLFLHLREARGDESDDEA